MQQNKIHMEVDTKGIIKISFLRASFPRDISKCTSEIWAHFSSELFQLNGSYKLLGLVIKLNFVILQLKNFNKSMYISVVEFWKITNHTMNSTFLLFDISRSQDVLPTSAKPSLSALHFFF